jgi:hypothetical protein
MSAIRIRRSEERPAPIFFRESDVELQQEVLDRVPDESPDDIEEQDEAQDAGHRIPADFVVLEDAEALMGREHEQPEQRERGVEQQGAAEYALRRAAALVDG